MKKRFTKDELIELKQKVREGYISKVGDDLKFNDIWQVIEDAAAYSFNASHSLSVALDSIYGAYLKANYPLEYFTTALNIIKDDTDKIKKIEAELPYFNIKILPPKFRYSTAVYSFNKEQNTIYKSIQSLKYLNKQVSDELNNLKNMKFNTFTELLLFLDKTSIDSRQLTILIKLNYFSEFGKNQKLLKVAELFKNINGKKQIKKDKLEELNLTNTMVEKFCKKETDKQYNDIFFGSIVEEYEESLPDERLSIQDQIYAEQEYLGYPMSQFKCNEDIAICLGINEKYAPKITLYFLNNGQTKTVKCYRKTLYDYNNQKDRRYFDTWSIIRIKKIENHNKKRKIEDKYIEIEEQEEILVDFSLVKR